MVADKPFAPDAGSARDLDAAARARGVILGVFHNRRWDSDLRSLARVVREGRPGSGLAHPLPDGLGRPGDARVDQMRWLLGPVLTVDAQLDRVDLPEGPTDAGFTLTLRHRGGAHSHLPASTLNRINLRELRA